MRKSISLLLTSALFFGTFLNASALTFTKADVNKYFLLPLGHHAVHYSYEATDGENDVTYTAIDRRTSLEASAEEMTVNKNGIISLFSGAKTGTSSTKYYRVSANGTFSPNIYTIAAYSNDFEASLADCLANTEIIEGGKYGKYIKGTNNGSFTYNPTYTKPSYVTVLEADVNFVSNDFKVRNLADGQYFITIKKSDVNEGWHNVKLILNWEDMVYHAMLDNIPLSEYNGQSITSTMTSAGLLIVSDGVDNFKFYGTSLDIPHTITVSGNENDGIVTVGEKVATSALKWINDSLVSSALEYKYVISDSLDGIYSEYSSGDSYTAPPEHKGQYIKAAARVKESDSVYGDWIYSEPLLVEEESALPVIPFEWTDTTDIIYAPQISGDVYKALYTHNGGGESNKTAVLGGMPSGASLDMHEGGYLFTVTEAAGEAAALSEDKTIQATITSMADSSKVQTVDIKGVGIYDFEDGDTSAFDGGTPHIKEADGNKYLDYRDTAGTGDYINYTFPEDLSGTDMLAIDFDILAEESNTVSLYFGNDLSREIAIDKLPASTSFKDRISADYYKPVPDGWNHVRIFLDLEKRVYSVFVNDLALSVNNEIPGYTGSATAKPKRIRFWSPIDNFTFANVTPIKAEVYNARLENIASGAENSASYDFYLGSAYDKCSTLKWYVSDNMTGDFELVSLGKGYTPDLSLTGKYVKAEIIPATEVYGDTMTGRAVMTEPVLITDVKVGESSLKIDGIEADIRKANISYGGEHEISLTVPAHYTGVGGKNVIFALAQYDASGNMAALSSETAYLTGENQGITLGITAKGFNDLSHIKLIVLDAVSLTPISRVTFLR